MAQTMIGAILPEPALWSYASSRCRSPVMAVLVKMAASTILRHDSAQYREHLGKGPGGLHPGHDLRA